MIYVALGELVVIVLLCGVSAWQARRSLEILATREESQREERFELQERIRLPEHKPRPAAMTRPKRDEDKPGDLTAMAQIGTVTPIRDNEAGSEGG